MVEASLESLQRMVQGVLDGQKMLRDDVRNARQRLSRIEQNQLQYHASEIERQGRNRRADRSCRTP